MQAHSEECLGLSALHHGAVRSKASFQGIEEVEHKSFRPRANDKDFFMGGSSSSQAAERGQSLAQGGVVAHRRGASAVSQGVEMPPASYFDPYFEGMGAQL